MSSWGSMRPTTFGECQGRPMPCPWVGCKYHALLDVIASGNIVINSGMKLIPGGGTRGRPKQATRRLPVWRQAKSLRPRAKQAESEDRRCDEIVETLEQAESTCVLQMVEGEQQHTLDQVGAMLNVSRERVRQIEDKALGKLMDAAGEEGLREMLAGAVAQRESGVGGGWGC